jgi:hypothetical protein
MLNKLNKLWPPKKYISKISWFEVGLTKLFHLSRTLKRNESVKVDNASRHIVRVARDSLFSSQFHQHFTSNFFERKVFFAVFLELQFGFVIFWQKSIVATRETEYWGRFHQHFTLSFYARRSKDLTAWPQVSISSTFYEQTNTNPNFKHKKAAQNCS